MDFSPEFVEMCRQAKEIQAQWKPQIGDFYEGYRCNVICTQELITAITADIREHKADSWVVWLPRQDQLQAMIPENRPVLLQKLYEFYNHFRVKDGSPIFRVTSGWEQLWLCFAMHELYKLQWNGSDWVVE